ncbi:MAG TPA: glycosyltransferase family 4 protein [Gemmatimonadaceae bacterium]|nr:glycosyltransferase family 4 protein [Gemmatimonadaceae bacterium]
MRICLISVEIFAWGKYGGFGRATRTIGRELAARGHEVYAVVPRRPGQAAVERLDGMTVLSYPPRRVLAAGRLLREVDAHVYHSCEPSLATYLAVRVRPGRAHVVTCRDPRSGEDWRTELALPSRTRLRVIANYLFESGPLVRRGVQRANAVYAAAHCLIPKAQAVYRLRRPPRFLPTPVEIPPAVHKAAEPTVCFVGRLDRRKRPEVFFRLVERFPAVRFVAVGASNDPVWDQHLRARYRALPNLELRGFVDQFRSDELGRILGQSWVLVNTSAREGLPNSMLEAAAHRCAILSAVDPDGFASGFGRHTPDGDFDAGLRFLLDADRWRERGLAGWRYVTETFETGRAIERHLAAYSELTGAAAGGA